MAAPRYPLCVALPRGRIRHEARLVDDGPVVATLCGKRDIPTGDGADLAWCQACANRPNPQDQRSSYQPEEA